MMSFITILILLNKLKIIFILNLNGMSESRLRLIKNLTSSIFSNTKEETWFRPSRKMTRDSSTPAHGSSRNQSPSSPFLKPLDHNKSFFYGDSPSDFYRKDISGIYNSPVVRLKKAENFDKIHNLPNQNTARSVSTSSRSVTPTYSKPSQLNTTLNTTSSPKATPKEAHLETISISNIPSTHHESDLKLLCQGLHLVHLSSEIDNLTGKALGRATISIRSNNSSQLDTLKYRLMQKGYQISTIAAKTGKKNNFHTAGVHFLNPKLQQEEKRLTANSLSCKERKQALLSSNRDLFGNTKCYFDQLDRSAEFKENRMNQESLRLWKLTKSVNIRSPTASRGGEFGYSRNTVSFSNKIVRRKV